jgi:hypothetical protein
MNASVDDIDAALSERAATPESTGDDIADALTARATGKPVEQPKEVSQPTEGYAQVVDPHTGRITYRKPDQSAAYAAAPSEGLVGNVARAVKETADVGMTALSGTAMGAVGGAADLLQMTGGDISHSARNWIGKNATYHPQTEGGKALFSGIDQTLPMQGIRQGLQATDTALGRVSPQLQQAGRVLGSAAQDVGQIAPVWGAARSLMKAPEAVPESATEAAVPQAVASEEAALTGGRKSGGAAAANADLSKVSPELRAAVDEAKSAGGIDESALQAHIDSETLPVPIRLTRGQATGDANLISAELNARAKTEELGTRFQEQNQGLIDNIKAIRDQSGPDVFTTNPYEHGQAIIEAYQAKDAPIKADIEAKYKALEDANGGQFPVDGEAFANNAYAALRKKLKTSFLPPSIESDLNRFRGGEPMSFEDFEAMRTNLASEMRKAARAGDGNAEQAASLVRDSLENLPLSADSANLKPIADAARAAAKARFDAFRADPAYEAAVDGTVEPDKFINEFVTGNGKKASVGQIQAMRQNLADNPTAVQTMKVSQLDNLRGAARVNGNWEGNFSQDGYNKLLQSQSAKFKALMDPNELETLDQLGRVAHKVQFRPTGTHAFVSQSQSLAESYAEHAKDFAASYINAKTGGLASPIIDKLRGRSLEKANQELLRQTLEPGAGIKKPQ